MSDTTPILYTHPNSRGRVARWMLEETGVPYETKIVEYGPAGMKAPAYLAINPMGKVPAIQHRGHVVTENAAICAYLADLAPDKRLAPPPGDPARGPYYRWLFFTAGPLEAMLMAKQAGAFTPARTAGYGNEGDTLDTLEQALAGKAHLAGDHFTAVDLYVAACLGFFMRMDSVAPRPAFVDFVQRHAARPAAIAAAARDDALAKLHPPAA